MSVQQPNDHDLRVWVSAELYLSIKHLSGRDDRNVSQWCRIALREAVNREYRRLAPMDDGRAGEGRDG